MVVIATKMGKRRSSVGLYSPHVAKGPLQGMSPSVTPFKENDDDAEKLRRRRAAIEAQEQFDTPTLSDRRKSVGGLAGLTAAQISEHYSSCIQLSAENKINTKNAFNLQLIDYMADMMRRNESEMNNFQVASCTLDASSKIYAYRVDCVHNDTLKMAGGLGVGSTDAASKDGGGDHADDEAKDDGSGLQKKARKRKKATTIERNLKNIDVNKFDLEFDVDPLFKKTSQQFDQGGANGGHFLSCLQIHGESCELLLDSDTVVSDVVADPHSLEAEARRIAVPFVDVVDLQICPTFSSFSFLDWCLEDDEVEKARQEEERRENEAEHAFDVNAEVEPIGEDFCDDYVDDAATDAGFCDEPREEEEVRPPIGQKALNVAEMLQHLASAPLDYSYFDANKLSAWAGPKHWKFKCLDKKNNEQQMQKKKSSKGPYVINYDIDEEDFEELEDMFQMTKLITILTTKTLKNWNREKGTLPEDFHYHASSFLKLKIQESISVLPITNKEDTGEIDVENYDYNNEHDADNYCPDLEEGGYDDREPDDLGAEAFASRDLCDTVFSDATAPARLDASDLELVHAPSRVDKIVIGYAKTAKKMNMKKLKQAQWQILTETDPLVANKENNGASPNNKMYDADFEGDRDRMEHGKSVSFTDLYATLKEPSKLPSKTMTENLSVPLAFSALLHLCNERELRIIGQEDLCDFFIEQG